MGETSVLARISLFWKRACVMLGSAPPPSSAWAAPTPSFAPGTAGTPTSLVELWFSARDLRDMDVFSKSDPMCVVYARPFGSTEYVEIHRTETLRNTLKPEFSRSLRMAYLFEEQQHLRFELYDVDSRSTRLADHDFIGSCSTTLGQIVASGRLEVVLVNHVQQEEGRMSGNGVLIVTSEEMAECKDDLELQFRARKLDRKDIFGSSDPFLVLSRSNESGAFVVVHRTEHLSNNLNPTWKQFTVPMRSLCNGDVDRNIKVEVFDHNRNGKHSLIGEFFVTVRQLQSGPGANNVFDVINPKKKNSKKSYKNSGTVELMHCSMVKAYSFLDYVRGGTELACTISIDFTQSNGAPQDRRSLHYLSQQQMNQYEVAIKSVGEIIQDYDSDKLFPVLGFGARLPPDGRVSHCFYVNGHTSNPYCQGIPGVLNAYRSCLSRIQLFGPTNFAPSIDHVANFARQYRDGSQYFILLILTDGIITDMPQTKGAIVEASTLPLSIIIVGVGEANFDAMEELDGDTVRVTSPSGKVAARDIVQFVPFRNFLRGEGLNSQMARLHLAKEVLAEIPDQFIGYMKANRIAPGSKTNASVPPDPEWVAAGATGAI